MNILISAGHTLQGVGTGAVGFLNESQENRVLAKYIVEYLQKAGHKADYHEVNQGSDYINQQAKKANSGNYDLVVQIHFNAGVAAANGTEVIYRSTKGKAYAQQVQDKLKTVFKDRKVKHDINDLNRDLGWLRLTNPVAILIETCFISNKSDTDKYKADRKKVAKLIAEGIIGKSIAEDKPTASTNTTKLYKICVGAYSDKDNATKILNQAKEKGFKDAYLLYE